MQSGWAKTATGEAMQRFALFLIAATLAACDPCSDYCAQDCECAGDESDSCQDTCLDTLEVYQGQARAAECSARVDALEETCR